MKKFVSFLFMLLISSALVLAQDAAAGLPNEEKVYDYEAAASNGGSVDTVGIHPWKDVVEPVNAEKAFCSLWLGGGFNVFDGDFDSEKKHGVYAPTVGLGFTYHFNSTWGLGVEYNFRQYKVTGKNDESTAATMLKGMSHQANAYLTFDIFNCFRPQNRHKLFALNLLLGGGGIWYKNSTFYPNEWHVEQDGKTITFPTHFAYHTKQQKPESDKKYKMNGVFMGGVSLEFNVSRDIALGLRGVYNYYTSDDLDGRRRANNNDGIFDVMATLRWKINATKKSHVANFKNQEILDRAVYADNSYVEEEPVSRPESNGYYRHGTGQEPVIIENQQIINNYYTILGDTVPKREVVIPEPVNNNKYYYTTQVTNIGKNQRYYYVYFDNAESKLLDPALRIIQQVADRLQREDSLYVVVTGFCDNTGGRELNNRLGCQRAKNVADELALEHGIDRNRIKEIGKGIIRGRRSTASYAPNRRADIELLTYEEFLKAEGQISTGEQAAPLEERVLTTRKAYGNYQTKTSVIVNVGESLSQFARLYFNNTHCWIYIYEANMDCMKSPNDIYQGMELVIPELTEEQCKITREEASERLKKLKRK